MNREKDEQCCRLKKVPNRHWCSNQKTNLRISEPGGVDLDEPGAVDQDLGSHVTKSDELLSVLQPLRRLHLTEGLQEGGTLSRSEAANELNNELKTP